MRVLLQYKVPRAEVTFVTIKLENIRFSQKEMGQTLTMLIIKIKTAPYFQLEYESLRLLIGDQ
jgi:hypothetical protein